MQKTRPIEDSDEPLTKKRRGRPPGARNKPKSNTEQVETLSLRERAERAADWDQEVEELSGQNCLFCRICNFDLKDPIKAGKKQIECPSCNFTVHEPCWIKDGCTCKNLSYL